ncbi:MAG: UvrD-helicase domain-containing protein [Endomicrobiia bacterium]|nr:UvrD-helicase domain-containing protein [Endomicrobiia bacterium]
MSIVKPLSQIQSVALPPEPPEIADPEHANLVSSISEILSPHQRMIFYREVGRFKNSELLPAVLRIASRLNPEQLETVFHEHKSGGPLLILACAGSGKTTSLVYRIIYLILQGVPPTQIMALTFTVKAAEEMRSRVRRFIDEIYTDVLPGADKGVILAAIARMWMGTFHSVALKILKENVKGRMNCELVGLRPAFDVVADNFKIIKEAFDTIFAGKKKVDFDDVVAKIEHVKNELLTVETFKERATRKEKKFVQVYERYQRLLAQRRSIDFNDMLIYVVRLFREYPDVLEHYRERFRYMMVDEYQDTNYAQYTMCKLLVGARPEFFCVGDDDQSIYGWRGADVRNILFFEKDYPNSTRVKLVRNYRSTATIISAANEVFRKVKPKHLLKIIEPLKNKFTGELEWGEKIAVYHARDERDEMKFVAFEINRLRALHPELKLSDFAVLYRTNSQNKMIKRLMDEEKIPYAVYDPRFWSRPEVRNIKEYLKIIKYYSTLTVGLEPGASSHAAPQEILEQANKSIKTVLTLPPASLHKEAYARITHHMSPVNILTDHETYEKMRIRLGSDTVDARNLGRFRALVEEISRESLFGEAMRGVIERSGLMSDLAGKSDPTREEAAALKIYKDLITEAEEFEKNTFAGSTTLPLHEKISLFLENIETKSRSTEQSAVKSKEDAVNVMTLHSAKGLEFDTVFFIGLEDNIMPLRHVEDKELDKKTLRKRHDEVLVRCLRQPG